MMIVKRCHQLGTIILTIVIFITSFTRAGNISTEYDYISSTTETGYDDFKQTDNYQENDYDYYNDSFRQLILVLLTLNFWVHLVLLLPGATGCLLVLVVFLKRPDMRTTANMYIANLALADLLVMVLLIPYNMYPINNSIMIRIFGSPSPIMFVGNIAQMVSVYTLVCLSVERLISIKRHTPPDTHPSYRYRAALLAVVWLFATGYVFLKFKLDGVLLIRLIDLMALLYSVLLEAVIGFLIPVILIATLNVSASHVLSQSSRNIPGENMKDYIDSRRRVTRVLFFLVANFVICYLPEHLFLVTSVVLDLFKLDIGLVSISVIFVMMVAAMWLRYLHSCLNPWVLCLTSTEWRKRFKYQCQCLMGKARCFSK